MTIATGDHLLHCHIDGVHGGVVWNLTCHHDLGDYPTLNDETGDRESDECWIPDWWDAAGEWPERIAFPCPVRCTWEGGLAVHYDGGTL